MLLAGEDEPAAQTSKCCTVPFGRDHDRLHVVRAVLSVQPQPVLVAEPEVEADAQHAVGPRLQRGAVDDGRMKVQRHRSFDGAVRPPGRPTLGAGQHVAVQPRDEHRTTITGRSCTVGISGVASSVGCSPPTATVAVRAVRVEEQDAVIVRAREPKVQAGCASPVGLRSATKVGVPTGGQAVQLAAGRAVGHGHEEVVAEGAMASRAWTCESAIPMRRSESGPNGGRRRRCAPFRDFSRLKQPVFGHAVQPVIQADVEQQAHGTDARVGCSEEHQGRDLVDRPRHRLFCPSRPGWPSAPSAPSAPWHRKEVSNTSLASKVPLASRSRPHA